MADANNKEQNGVGAQDHAAGAGATRHQYNYGGNPLAREDTSTSARLPAFGGELQPGLFRAINNRKFANPAPLGLCAFALTTFLLALTNLDTHGIAIPNIVVGPAFAYGGLVQILAGMWEMAVGNTFGATALTSYGGFWIGFAIILTPGGFAISDQYPSLEVFYIALSYYLFGWFIFTFLLLLATLRSTVAFFLLFFFLDMAFLLLGIGFYMTTGGANAVQPEGIVKAGGVFAILSAFAAWYNALAGILDRGNSFFLVPVAHFPWSEKGRKDRGKPPMMDAENVEGA